MSPKPRIREMSPAEVAEEVRTALLSTNGVSVMIGPGCSISPDTPEANLDAARDATTSWKPAR